MTERKVFQKCGRCGNWFEPDLPRCPYCRSDEKRSDVTPQPRHPPARRSGVGNMWSLAFIIVVTVVLVGLSIWEGSLSQAPATNLPTTSLPTVRPTRILRPLCVNRRGALGEELTELVLRETGTELSRDIRIDDVVHEQDRDRDGEQLVIIDFQAYKPGTGKYPKGKLVVFLDDRSCDIVGFELLW